MRLPRTVLGHAVVILARGHGSRLASVASGRHKTMEHLDGHSILAWILRELEGVIPTGIFLHLREPDPAAETVAAAHPQTVTVSTASPSGYLPDVAACQVYGARFTVIEADTIVHPGALRNFLILADYLGAHVDLCMGVAPRASNPNGPAVIVDITGLVQAVSWTAQSSGLVPLGAWHWTASMLADAAVFSARSTSIADYITWRIPQGALVAPIGFPAGHNINTPADLAHARVQVAAWTTLHERYEQQLRDAA